MSILNELQKMKIQARKAGQSNAVTFLSYAIGKIESVGKNNGNRETTEDEALSAIKRMISDNNAIMELDDNEATVANLTAQNDLLELVMPQMADEAEIREFIETLAEGSPNFGQYMRSIKERFGSAVDMKLAGDIVKSYI